nr:hypothetical protein CFP56_63370 [Quercus suber]POE94786.1 hypothetical protein CFP56_17023 [Quercus suber]
MDATLRKTPVIVGIADIVNRSKQVKDAIEPAQLMLQAIESAFQDTQLHLTAAAEIRSQIDALYVVRTWTWPYPDLPGLLSGKLGVDPTHQEYSDHGGNSPAAFVDEAARRVSKGQSKVAVVTGGEALASYVGARHAIGNPIQLYPLYENGFRAHRNQSIHDNHVESAELYAEFAKVAEVNEYAWNHGNAAETKDSIGTVSKKNRMICLPCRSPLPTLALPR